jgi:glycyl-tRNA synthetase beta subunit
LQVLAQELGALVAGLSFGRSMRWNSAVNFSRPVRWLLAMHGPVVVPFAYGSLKAGDTTRVLRSAEDPEVVVPTASQYWFEPHTLLFKATFSSFMFFVYEDIQAREFCLVLCCGR